MSTQGAALWLGDAHAELVDTWRDADDSAKASMCLELVRAVSRAQLTASDAVAAVQRVAEETEESAESVGTRSGDHAGENGTTSVGSSKVDGGLHGSTIAGLLLDAVWVFTCSTDWQEEAQAPADTAEREDAVGLVAALVRELVASGEVPKKLALERLEWDLCEAAGLVRDGQYYHRRTVRANTTRLYTQPKYNLLREQSEGYAKLVAELTTFDSSTDSGIENALEHVRSLIGHFELCPNRCFDLVLEVFERRLCDAGFVQVLRAFDVPKLTDILGFKFQAHARGNTLVTPQSLYVLAALLLKHEYATLEGLYPHLSPADDAMEAEYAAVLKGKLAAARKIGVVSLAAKPSDSVAADTARAKSPAAAALTEEAKRSGLTAEEIARMRSNQKIGLLWGALQVHHWPTARVLLQRFRAVAPASVSHVGLALSKHIAARLESHYRAISPMSSTPLGHAAADAANSTRPVFVRVFDNPEGMLPDEHVSEQSDLLRDVFPLAEFLESSLFDKPVILAKLIRLVRHELEKSKPESAAREACLRVLRRVVLPSFAAMDGNCGMALEVWSTLRSLNFGTRYGLYRHLRHVLYERDHTLFVRRYSALDATKKVMRRLSTENWRQHGRKLAKIAHCSAIIVFDYVIGQLQTYDNMIQPVVDSLRYLTPLGFDMLSFVILDQLSSSSKAKLKEDGLNEADFLQSLSTFCGILYRKYPTTELEGLLQYIVEQLRRRSSLDLLVLKSLITRMVGIEAMEDATHAQLYARGGGPLLRLESSFVSSLERKAMRKSATKLQETLIQKDMVLPLTVLVAQQRASCLYDTESSHLKLIGELYDRCHEVLLQLVEFCQSQTDRVIYSKLMPRPVELVRDFRLPVDVVFFLSRPVLRATNAVLDGRIVDVVEALAPHIRAPHWISMTPKLYGTFWAMSLYDIHVPHTEYDAAERKLNNELAAASASRAESDSRRRKERDRIEEALKRLAKERTDQEEAHKRILAKIRDDISSFLTKHSPDGLLDFVNTCILPRAVFSQVDALYCAHFIEILHRESTPHFSTPYCINTLVRHTPSLLAGCTNAEASRLGNFMHRILSIALRWRSSKSAYTEECQGSVGFRRDASPSAPRGIGLEAYRKITFKWLVVLAHGVLPFLRSNEHMEIRNVLVFMTQLGDTFPLVHRAHSSVEALVAKLKEDSREDVRVLASRYHAHLTKAKATLLSDSEFQGAAPAPDPESAPPAAREAEEDASAAPQRTKRSVSEAQEAGNAENGGGSDRLARETHERDRSRGSSRDRGHTRSASRDRDRNREGSRGASVDRDRHRERDHDRYRARDRERSRGRERERDRERSRGRDRVDEHERADDAARARSKSREEQHAPGRDTQEGSVRSSSKDSKSNGSGGDAGEKRRPEQERGKDDEPERRHSSVDASGRSRKSRRPSEHPSGAAAPQGAAAAPADSRGAATKPHRSGNGGEEHGDGNQGHGGRDHRRAKKRAREPASDGGAAAERSARGAEGAHVPESSPPQGGAPAAGGADSGSKRRRRRGAR